MIKKITCMLMFALLSLAAYADSEPYAVLSSDGLTVTFYYDGQKDSRGGIELGILNNGDMKNREAFMSVTTAIFDESFAAYRPTSTSRYFSYYSALTTIKGMKNLKTDQVEDMDCMFVGCESLTDLDVSNFNTANVESMRAMFAGCSGLTTLNLSNFNTNNVTDMREMFSGCINLTDLDLSSFNTANVTSMCDMFADCESLSQIDVSHFNTANVTNMGNMFSFCSSLTNLDVSGFNTENVTDIWDMFRDCKSLTTLDVSNFKTDNVTRMDGMFAGCSGLTTLDVTGFKTDKVTDMGRLFEGCSGLTSLDVSSFKTDKVTEMRAMFDGCSGLTSLDISGFNTEHVNNMEWMFSACSGLTTLDLSGFKTDNVTDMSMMFSYCTGLTDLDVSGFRTDNVESMNNMFRECSGLKELDVSGFNTDKVIDMTCMFENCSKLKSLDVSNFNTENVGYMSGMFSDCPKLTVLDLSSFNTSNVTTMRAMFYGCKDLCTIYVSESLWDTSLLDRDENIFGKNDNLTGGNGTTYRWDHASVEYARIDKPGTPGLLTAKTVLTPMKDQENVNYGEDGGAEKYANLSGTIIDNIFYNISSANGGFDADDNCIVVNKAMTDEDIEAIFGKDIFSNEVKTNYAGIIIKVPQGNGKVTIQAQATGGMTLMVKIGSADPVKKELSGKQVVDIPYDVDRPAYVYIYAGMSDNSASTRMRGEQSSLRIYSLGVSKESTSIVAYSSMPESAGVYSIDGRLIRKSTTSLQNLPKGIYIRNGKKYIVK